jgi:hypothetical protein
MEKKRRTTKIKKNKAKNKSQIGPVAHAKNDKDYFSKSNISEAEFQLRKLFYSNLDIFNFHQWPREGLRWAELLFSLLSRINYNHLDILRDMIGRLDYLELLDVEKLAYIQEFKGNVDLNSPYASRISEILYEYGFNGDESMNSIQTMHEAAKNLMENHSGMIQKYFRKYGQMMLDEINQNFSFSKMNKDEVRYAFTFWLQNVLNMPISLQDQNTKDYCARLGLKPEEFMEVADKLDINLAVVDDLISNLYPLNNKREEEIIANTNK